MNCQEGKKAGKLQEGKSEDDDENEDEGEIT